MKYFFILAIFLFLTSPIAAQETITQDKITLLSGETYFGEIVLKTDEMIMIKTSDGKRYQFQLSQIKSIEKVSLTADNLKKGGKTEITGEQIPKGDFCGSIEFSGGISSAQNAFANLPNVDVSMVFGNKSVGGKDMFFGLGASYKMLFPTGTTQTVDFIPVFMRLQSILIKTNTAPYVSIDAGYSFGLSTGFDGGPFVKVSGGVIRKINHKSDFFAGIFAELSSIKTNLTETNPLGTFHYYGSTSMTNVGLRFGLHF